MCDKSELIHYPKLWGDNASTNQTNQASEHMPNTILPGTEESFHWARSMNKKKLASKRVAFSTHDNGFILSRWKHNFSRNIVVSQEFALSTLFLAGHRCLVCHTSSDINEFYCDECFIDDRTIMAIHILTLSLVIIVSSTIFARESQFGKKQKMNRIRSRIVDAILIAGIIRILSSVLRTLTASYSSDTVSLLAVSGMIIHVFSLDYEYANGKTSMYDNNPSKNLIQNRPLFLGGTISINCVFFSTALLASRLTSDSISYGFFMWTTIMFAYYPEARHLISRSCIGFSGT